MVFRPLAFIGAALIVGVAVASSSVGEHDAAAAADAGLRSRRRLGATTASAGAMMVRQVRCYAVVAFGAGAGADAGTFIYVACFVDSMLDIDSTLARSRFSHIHIYYSSRVFPPLSNVLQN